MFVLSRMGAYTFSTVLNVIIFIVIVCVNGALMVRCFKCHFTQLGTFLNKNKDNSNAAFVFWH